MTYRVFVSSTFTDLKDFRESVQRTIRQFGATDVSMENFGARDERPKDECLRIVREESDLFVGIYAHRYGFIPPGDTVSITETEYNVATGAGLPRFIYIVDDQVPWVPGHIDFGENADKLREFKNKLKLRHICQSFQNQDQLAARVIADLGRYIALRSLTRVSPDSPKSIDGSSPQTLKTVDEWNKYRNGMYKGNRGVFIAHVLAPSQIEGQEFDIFIYLIRHKSEDLSDIDYAEFFFGPHWDNKIFRIKERHGFIGISTAAYGTFLCICRVTFKDGYQVFLHRYIDFEMQSAAN